MVEIIKLDEISVMKHKDDSLDAKAELTIVHKGSENYWDTDRDDITGFGLHSVLACISSNNDTIVGLKDVIVLSQYEYVKIIECTPEELREHLMVYLVLL